jgi:glycosyltransferase involved in cell wall biosynthesis
MISPQVTVIVPIYNGAEYLRETLESLLSQSFTDFELLAIDDGSTDDSCDIVEAFKDDRIRLIRKRNGGLCDALNRGIAEARAPFLARNDQDDLSMPGRLERQLDIMKSRPSAIAMFAFNTKIGGKHNWSNRDKLAIAPGQMRVCDPLRDGSLLGSTMFARVGSLRGIGGFRQAFYPADDFDLECRLCEAGKVLVLCEPLVAYRFRMGANTYRVFSEMQQKSRWTINSHQFRVEGKPELTFEAFLAQEPKSYRFRLAQYQARSAKLQMRLAGQYYLDGNYIRSAAKLCMAAVLDPGNIITRVIRLLK